MTHITQLQQRTLALNKRRAKDKQAFTNFINISLQQLSHGEFQQWRSPRDYQTDVSQRESSQFYGHVSERKEKQTGGVRSIFCIRSVGRFWT